MDENLNKYINSRHTDYEQNFNILSFPGGGVKGVLSSTILERLTNERPELIDKTTIFCGTSTGSLIAAGLAYGLTPREITDVYSYENCRYIFTPKGSPYFKPEYENYHLQELIDNYFPRDLTLNDLDGYIIIISFNLGSDKKSWKPIIYNNFPGSSTGNTRVRDALLSSAAAPVYFPSYNHNVDGGVIANDPSLISLAFAISYLGATPQNTSVLTIGTGSCEVVSIPQDTSRWGAIEWIIGPGTSDTCVQIPILDLAISGNVYITDFLVNTLLRFRYLKIEPELYEAVALDDYTEVPYLKEVGLTYPLETEYDWIDIYWR